MKVVVFGATGKTGSLAWRLARDRGLEVTVFGRSVEQKYADEDVRKVQGDVLDAGAVARAVEGQDAVLVCLGPVGLSDKTTLTDGATHIAAAMEAAGVQRVVFVSAAGVGNSWSHIPWYSKVLFATLLRTILAEHGREEDIFAQSHLRWTAVRAAVLTSKPSIGSVVASNTGHTTTITRADLAAFLVDQLASDAFADQAIAVTNG